MLSRRVLRIKAMQAVYAFVQSGSDRVDEAERRMIENIEKIYDLYIWQLSFLCEISDYASNLMETGRQKHLPTDAELNPNTRFIDNSILRIISEHPEYRRRREALKINWSEQQTTVRKLFQELKLSELYSDYMAGTSRSLNEDGRFVSEFFKAFICECDELQQFYEEINVYWADDFDIANIMVVKTIAIIQKKAEDFVTLPALYGENQEEEEQDRRFVRELFGLTLIHSEEYDVWVQDKAENWDLERIALMDLILLRMALTELLHFRMIPIKVTINEYIEVSKMYSSAKSKVFINGILDKLVVDLKDKGLITKSGRGLME